MSGTGNAMVVWTTDSLPGLKKLTVYGGKRSINQINTQTNTKLQLWWVLPRRGTGCRGTLKSGDLAWMREADGTEMYAYSLGVSTWIFRYFLLTVSQISLSSPNMSFTWPKSWADSHTHGLEGMAIISLYKSPQIHAPNSSEGKRRQQKGRRERRVCQRLWKLHRLAAPIHWQPQLQDHLLVFSWVLGPHPPSILAAMQGKWGRDSWNAARTRSG